MAGLIAAGGALFAAWLAWSAVRDQIAFEIARDDAARAANQASKINLAKAELTGLKLTGGHVDKILAGFRGVDASSEWNYVDDLRKMNKAGMLSFFSQPLPMPLAGTAGHLSNKLVTLAARIEATDRDKSLRPTDTPLAISPELRRACIELDQAIKQTVDDYIALQSASAWRLSSA